MRVTVIGAGLVGLASALALAKEGHAVTLMDREGPGAGASRGNAGWIAHTDIDPIASPKMLRQVPRFLLDPLGPLAIRPAYLWAILPWLTRLLLASRKAPLQRSIEGLVALQRRAMPAWEALSADLDLRGLIHRRGGLFVFDSPSAMQEGMRHFQRQQALGIRCDILGPDALGQLEPALSPSIVGGGFFPDAAHVADPLLVTQALFAAARARGIVFERAEARRVEPGPVPLIRLAEGTARLAERIVIAAGAWSKGLAAGLGDDIPLDTERGYNVSFAGARGLLNRPVAFPGHGFVATPLDTGLRIGGAVELGGLALPPNHERSRALHCKATRFLRGLPAYETGSQWMGFRPSIPDSLPVIGHARGERAVVYAFGHGHYGLTQAAATGELVADLVAGREPGIDLSPFSPQRF